LDHSASYTKKLFPENPLIGCPGYYGLLRHYIPLWDFFAISDNSIGKWPHAHFGSGGGRWSIALLNERIVCVVAMILRWLGMFTEFEISM